MNQKLMNYIVEKTNLQAIQIENTLKLTLEEACTVPFIARYRKEKTRNLDESQIRDVISSYEEFTSMEKRREFVITALQKQDKLTNELKASLLSATTEEQIEEIYRPFKLKKKTKAMIAKEKGLEPFALDWIVGKKSLNQIIAGFTFNKEVEDEAQLKEGIEAIIIEQIVYFPDLRPQLSQAYEDYAILTTEKKKDAEKVADFHKFKDYFEFNETIKSLLKEGSSHRYLAIRRGVLQKVLKMSISIDQELVEGTILKTFEQKVCAEDQEQFKNLVKKSIKLYLHPSLETEVLTKLKLNAEKAAISVFGENLKNLLLAPYLGAKVVLGVDPGIRTGCKLVVIGESGALLFDHVVYLNNQNLLPKSKAEVETIIDKFKVEFVAIGNGTYGRESLDFFENHIAQVKENKVSVTMISEAGASVYSASKAAGEEFPDKDVTVRGAVSIARRFQDPMAELVKIDPRSIGVGQYQHDVSETKLKKSLAQVVEDSVNYVGVDLNTASYHLLSFISGIGLTVAKNIVSHREKNGSFQNREQLKKVTRFTDKVFQQSAGFLRIYDGSNPLDGTFVHPEHYQDIQAWCEKKNTSLHDLINEDDKFQNFSRDHDLKAAIGPHTFQDILDSIKAPSQDPRTVFESVQFDRSLKSLEDVKVNQWYNGIINNLTNFGAFVDIGLKNSGLIHVSQLSENFVDNPMKVVKVGQEVKARVIEVDIERGRLSLSLLKENKNDYSGSGKQNNGGFQGHRSQRGSDRGNFQSNHRGSEQSAPRKSAFSALKNFKVK